MQRVKSEAGYSASPRQSNIELLRIIAMIIIVAHHFAYHGGFNFSGDAVTVNRLWVRFIEIGGKIGVNIFVLISGYFLVSAKEIKTDKALKLWLEVFTYSLLFFVVSVLCGLEQFGIKNLIKHCFPMTFSRWWFASAYFVLYLVSPYINRLLTGLDKKQYRHFLLLLGFLWCIIPTFTAQKFQSNNLLWFIFLYAFAGYIKLFKPKTDTAGGRYILCSAALTLLTFLSAVVFDILGTEITFFAENAAYFYDMQRLPVFFISVLTFIGFSKINIGYKRLVNIISSATFGVYLIHDNKYVRPFLWKIVFKNASYAESSLLIPYSLSVIAVVFICCTVIELARIYILERHYMKAVNSASIVIDRLKDKISVFDYFDKI